MVDPLLKGNVESPDKPLACYEGELPLGVPDLSQDEKSCGTPTQGSQIDRLMKVYQRLDEEGRDQCSAYPRGPDCLDWEKRLPILARNIGVISSFDSRTNPFYALIPYLDLQGINDIRSTEVLLRMIGEDPTLRSVMQETGELAVLYQGSGSHIAPLAMAFAAAAKGEIKKARFTFTETDQEKDALNRIARYLSLMEKIGLIHNLRWKGEVSSLSDEPNSSVTLLWEHRGIPMELTYAINCEGTFWATDADLASHDVILLHDSIYQSSGLNGEDVTGDNFTTDRLIFHLNLLTRQDRRRRVVISEDQWAIINPERDSLREPFRLYPCSASGTCSIGKVDYPVRHHTGFYGHGVSMNRTIGKGITHEFISTSDGHLERRPPPEDYSYPILHLGGKEEGALVIEIKP